MALTSASHTGKQRTEEEHYNLAADTVITAAYVAADVVVTNAHVAADVVVTNAAATDLNNHFAGPPTGGALSVAELDVLDAVAQAAEAKEVSTGVITQLATNVGPNTPTYSADGDMQHGQLQTWMLRVVKTADGAFDAPATITNFFGGTKKTRANKYRFVKIGTTLHTLRTGGVPDHDLRIEIGDGAASEVFTTLVGDFDIDGDTPETINNRNAAAWGRHILNSGETLRVQLAVSGTTTTGVADVCIVLNVVPVEA